jgi:paraquat-inducible protein A
MPDVFLLGLLVAYGRLKASISVEVGVGAYCFIAVGILTLFIRATLDKPLIWRLIMADSKSAPGAALVTCPACDLVLEQHAVGKPCPRCAAAVHGRKPDAIARALALTVAGAILYLPANIYPIATLPIGFTSFSYNILGGAIELMQSRLYPYAALVIIASFAIPIVKLAGIGWCIASVEMRSGKALRAKTRVYRIIEEIGRWSMVDPFVIACFVPVSEYSSLVYGRAQPAAQAFTAVVILTIFAARCFDPRLMWDRARKTP